MTWLVPGMTVDDVAAAMNVPIVDIGSRWYDPRYPDRSRRLRSNIIGAPPADTALVLGDDGTISVYRVAGSNEDTLHELAHLMHEDSFKDELPVLVWQALVITYLEPELAYTLARDMEGYYFEWIGSLTQGFGSVYSFDDWIRSKEFCDLHEVAREQGIIDEHGPVLRRFNL
jgi:hypothetical protein